MTNSSQCYVNSENTKPCVINEETNILLKCGQLKYNRIINIYNGLFHQNEKYIPILWKQDLALYFEQKGYSLLDAFLLGIECNYDGDISKEDLDNYGLMMIDVPYLVRRLVDIYEALPTWEDVVLFNKQIEKECHLRIET